MGGMTAARSQHGSYPFNTPLEAGIRMLALLSAASPSECDLQRLSYYDYLVVHSADVRGGPESIHPPTPHRSGEFLVRRGLVERALLLMFSRGLVARVFSERGILYLSSKLTNPFLEHLEAPYTKLLRDRAVWVLERFGKMSDTLLRDYFREHLGQWGAEFIRESGPPEE
jgi:hypothetical protein